MLFKRLKENGKDSKFLDLDFMQPYGITPFKFGLITIIWTIVVFGFGVFAVLDQTMSTELWLVLLLVPEISFFVFKKLTEWSFNEIIVPLTNVVHSYNMIIEAKPTWCWRYDGSRIIYTTWLSRKICWYLATTFVF